jgi:hypothetical protein
VRLGNRDGVINKDKIYIYIYLYGPPKSTKSFVCTVYDGDDDVSLKM